MAGFDVTPGGRSPSTRVDHRRPARYPAGRSSRRRAAVEEWVAGFAGRVVHVAVEATTGWLFVSRGLEPLRRRWRTWPSRPRPALCGVARAAPRPTALTRDLRQLLSMAGCRSRGCRLSTCARARARASRLRNTLVARAHRVAAADPRDLVSPRCSPARPDELRTLAGRRLLAGLELPVDARERIKIALEIIDAARRTARRDRAGSARARAPTGRLPGADGPVRDRARSPRWSRPVPSSGTSRDCTPRAKPSGMAGMEMRASNCTSCGGDFGLRDVAGVRDPFAAFLLDGGAERDPQAVGTVAVGGELVV